MSGRGRFIVAEYRSSKAETINWRDKTTGRAMSAVALRHVLESGGDSVVLTERTPEGFDPAKWASPFQKGQMVAVHFTEWAVTRGMISARGTIEVLG